MIALVAIALGANVQLETFDHVVARVPEVHPDADLGCAGCAVRFAEVAARLRKDAKRAKDAESLRPLLGELLASLGQSHYGVLPGSVPASMAVGPVASASSGGGAPGHAGLSVATSPDAVVIWRVEPGSPAEVAGLAPGDVIRGIDGQPVQAVLSELFGSLDPKLADLVARAVLQARLDGPSGTAVAVELGDRTVDVQRTAEGAYTVDALGMMPGMHAVWSERQVPLHPEPDASTARVLRLDVFALPAMERLTAAMERAIAQDAAVILDLRGNPGGVIQIGRGVAGFFASERGSLGTMRTRGADLDLAVHPRPRAQRFEGPLAILIDGASGSTSEILAAALQESGRARVFGEASAGMALPSQFESLPNGDVLQLSIGDLLTPGGARIEAVGVQPDVAVPRPSSPTEDPVIAAAVRWLAEVTP